MEQTKRRRGNPGTHGDSRHGDYYRLYRVWIGMKSRCYCKNDTSYARYGGKGVHICDEWQTWEPFKEWSLAHGYQDGQGLSIDRIDFNGNYSPDNCRWTNASVQGENRSNNPRYEYNGETHTLTEWSRITGINKATLYKRIVRRGWPVDVALTTPLQNHTGKKFDYTK